MRENMVTRFYSFLADNVLFILFPFSSGITEAHYQLYQALSQIWLI